MINFRIDYKGVPRVKLEVMSVFGIAESTEELDALVNREKTNPSFGKFNNMHIYEQDESFIKDILKESIFKHGYDQSIFIRRHDISELIPEEKRTAITNYFNLPKKVIQEKPPEPEKLPEPEEPKPKHEQIEEKEISSPKEEKHLTEKRKNNEKEFIEKLQERNIAVHITTPEDADYKRIRFKALGFETLMFRYRDKAVTLISTEEFSNEILDFIKNIAKEKLHIKIDVEIGLPEIVGEPQEILRPDSVESAIDALKKSLLYRQKPTEQMANDVVKFYPELWDNLLNRCYEYDEQTGFYYKLRKDWHRTIRGIAIYSKGLTKLVATTDNVFTFTSFSENPKKKDEFYTVTIKFDNGDFIMDSNDPDRISDAVVGISIDGKRQVERFITKHMVSALICFIHR